ncbi:MAG: Phenoxybenzoate dioxygenase subunit beta [Actinomycetota bacterium]
MSVFGDVERDCLVEARTEAAAGVVVLDLVAVNGRDLPPWAPGSHIDLLLQTPAGVVERQYSLCGDPADRQRYRVGVLREASGRGGSEFVHVGLLEGDRVRIRGPRNHFSFPATPGVPVLFIAGGIGVTPFVSMCAAAEAAGIDFTLHYAGRSRSTMAFARELDSAYGRRVMLHPSDEGARLDVDAVLGAADAAAHVFTCGPKRLLEAVELACSGWASDRLHLEHFEAKEFGAPVWQDSFEVELALTGVTVEVPLERSILDVVEDQGVLVVSSCRKGTCGTCEAPVVEGEIEHRDSILTPSEQEAGDTMMICVSRAAGPRLVLDL